MTDETLLASGDFARLLARYETRISQRCVAKLRGHLDADDVAQNVKLRLFREAQRGKTYTVPYGVVVNKVIEWTVKEYWQGRDTAVPLPEGWEPATEDDPAGTLIVEEALADLAPREREACTLVLVEGLSPDQAATELGTTRNNIDQALHRGRKKLREKLDRG